MCQRFTEAASEGSRPIVSVCPSGALFAVTLRAPKPYIAVALRDRRAERAALPYEIEVLASQSQTDI